MGNIPKFDMKKLGIDEYFIHFDESRRDILLEDWKELIGDYHTLLYVTKAGDAFTYWEKEDMIYHLNPNYDYCFSCFSSVDRFEELMQQEELRSEHLKIDFVDSMRENGLELKDEEVYSLIAPDYLSGEYEFSNVQVIDAEVHFSMNAQIFKKSLPEEVAELKRLI